MSPVPPPPHVPTYTEDWTNDTSFDLPTSPTRLVFSTSTRTQTPHSPSSSSSRSRSSRGPDVHTSSPLRQLVSPTPARLQKAIRPDEGDDDDFLLDDEVDVPLVLSSKISRSELKQTPRQAKPSSGSIRLRQKPSPTSSIGSSSSVIQSLTKTITHAPGGAITRFSSAPKNKKLSPVSVKAKEKAVERAWERDFDFDDDFDENKHATLTRGMSRMAALRPSASVPVSSGSGKKGFIAMTAPVQGSWGEGSLETESGITIKRREQPGPDALDDLDDLEGFGDGFEEDEATLKAGATLKALLPPPRKLAGSTNSTHLPASASAPISARMGKIIPLNKPKPAQEEDLETDFILPLNLDSLALVDQFNSRNSALASQTKRSRPRTSASTAASGVSGDWDSPHPSQRTGTTSGRKGFWGDDTDSPRGFSDSITSATSSMSIHTPKDKSKDLWDGDEEEDMEAGLVLPTTLFGGKGLQGLLVEKTRAREQEAKNAFAAQVAQFGLKPGSPRVPYAGASRHGRDGTDETTRTENESIEDGLVFDDPGRELSKRQLERARKTRTPLVGPGAGKRTVSGGSNNGSNGGSWGRTAAQKERDRAREKEREQGWGRHTPLPRDVPREREAAHNLRDRKQAAMTQQMGGVNGGGIGWGNRSHSATVNTKESLRRADSPASIVPTNRPRTSMNAITMPPPPPPPLPSAGLPPSTPSRLRHQKSHAALPTTPSRSITRKRSMPSLAETNPLSPGVKSMGTSQMGQSQSAFVNSASTNTASTDRWYSSASRATGPTSSSLAKVRSTAAQGIFSPGIGQTVGGYVPSSRGAGGSGGKQGMSGVARYVAASANARTYDGSELDSIDDLDFGSKNGSLRKRTEKSRPNLRDVHTDKTKVKAPTTVATPLQESKSRNKPETAGKTGSFGRKRGIRAGVGLISAKGQQGLSWMQKHAEHADVHFNPDTGRWEGNEENKTYARIFDETPSRTDAPTRPALITPLGTVQNSNHSSSTLSFSSLGKQPTLPRSAVLGVSGVTGSAPGVPSAPANLANLAAISAMRVVGDMKFDPVKMCWVSNLDPEDDEPDPFEGWGDDEDEEKGGTIKVIKGRLGMVVGGQGWGRLASESGSAGSFEGDRAVSGAGEVGGQGGWGEMGGSTGVGKGGATTAPSSQFASTTADQNSNDKFRDECQEAERRHRREMRDWASIGPDRKEEAVRRAKEGAWQIRRLASGVRDA